MDDTLRKDSGCSSELDYIEQASWVLFLKYLDDFEEQREASAKLNGESYKPILSKEYAWTTWAVPKTADGKKDYNTARTGDDLKEFVDGKLFPYHKRFNISAEEFIQRLFNTLNLPEFFGTEDTLRKLWSNPFTRSELLKKLEQHGCGKSDLIKLQEMFEAENSDLFDVLEYISYERKPMTRAERVEKAQGNIYNLVNQNQKEFIDFVLRNYVQEGVDELDISKLSATLTSKYGSVFEGQKA